MDLTDILEPLNDAQREAVTAPPGHVLVLAGAGSGKTRVLVHRIAWLLEIGDATPFGILAVTFTNKAASEMRFRIESILGRPAGGMWVGTFHGLAHRLLRLHWRDVGLPEGFQILDSDDQLRCIRRVLRDLGLDEQLLPPKQAQTFINGRKDVGLRAEHLENREDISMRQMHRVYKVYQETCERIGVVDFAELLLRCHELFRDREDVLAHYRDAVPPYPRRRVSGHQHHSVRVAEAARGKRESPVLRRGRRSVGIQLAWRPHKEHPAVSQ